MLIRRQPGKNHRIDNIAASFHLQVVNAGSFVEVDLATTEREDHRPVFAEIVLAPAPFVSPKRQASSTVQPENISDSIPWARKIEFESCK